MGKLFVTELGQPTEVDAVRYYTKNDQNYLIYTKNEKDDQGYVKLYAMKVIDENGALITRDITNPTEWNEVRETVKQIVNESRENIPSTIQNLDMSVLENLNVTEKHVFKLAENIVAQLASDATPVEENTMEPAVEENHATEEVNDFENGRTTLLDMFQPTFDQANEQNNDLIIESESQEEIQNDIDELDLSDIAVDHVEQNIEETSETLTEEPTMGQESVVLPEEELTDVTLMNVPEEPVSTETSENTWDQFEMPVPLVEENKEEETVVNETEESTPSEEESKPRGFFETLFGKKQKEPEVETNTEEPAKTDEVQEMPVFGVAEETQDASLAETGLLNGVANEIQNMNQQELFVENSLPVAEETTEEMPAEDGVQKENEMNQPDFDYQNFDPMNEAPSYEVPSFESLGLDDLDTPNFNIQGEEETKSDVNLEEANYQTLYFDEKRKNEDLEEKIHLLEIQLEDQKRKIEDVKNIIL